MGTHSSVLIYSYGGMNSFVFPLVRVPLLQVVISSTEFQPLKLHKVSNGKPARVWFTFVREVEINESGWISTVTFFQEIRIILMQDITCIIFDSK